MRILGIDPGLGRTGFGILLKVNRTFLHVDSGVIQTKNKLLWHRLKAIFQEINRLIDSFKPEIAVVEKIFLNQNPQSTLSLSQARGAALAAIGHAGVNCIEYSPLQIKKAVTGYGHASKLQMQNMVQKLLQLSFLPSEDAADALGCAICHANHSFYLEKTSKRELKES